MSVNADTVCYCVAETAEERQRYFSIRKNAFAEDLRIPVKVRGECTSDEGAQILLAKVEGNIVGGARLVSTAPEDLPLAKLKPDFLTYFPEGISSDGKCTEYGALAMIPSHRNQSVTLGLYLYSESIARSIGIEHVFFSSERVRARLYRMFYKRAYGKMASPPSTYAELCEFVPEHRDWQSFGEFTLSVVSFH